MIDERAFWAALETSERLLAGSASAGAVEQVRELWRNIDAVRLADGTVLTVDMRWLLEGIAGEGEIPLTVARIRALLTYRSAFTTSGNEIDSRRALSTLERMAAGYQFPDEPPEPLANTQPVGFDLPIPSGLAEVILVVGGAVLAGALLLYLARGLNVQATALPTPDHHEDDPTTSSGAHDLAGLSEQAGDYRAAVRYLYLAALLTLDERGLIRYDRTLTNREHLAQIADRRELFDALRPVVNTFERVWYGFAVISEVEYREYREQVGRLANLAGGEG